MGKEVRPLFSDEGGFKWGAQRSPAKRGTQDRVDRHPDEPEIYNGTKRFGAFRPRKK